MFGLVLIGTFVGYLSGAIAWLGGASFLQGLAIVSISGVLTIAVLTALLLLRSGRSDVADMNQAAA
ncbi:hypothetical protein ACRARG_17370 [Pseudooceanicola sp. C21-150M6]|uniref:hypothetical protein n=1 Tax=Pseudooceanicola sp. C21-150M6 TaxID=3434355 RepID=UPI003D7F5CC3